MNEVGYAQIGEWLDGWILDLNGETFSRQDLYQELNIGSRQSREYLRKQLSIRVANGAIKQEGKLFRKPNKGLRKLNWQTSYEDEALDLVFPMGLEEWVQLYPGSIIVISSPPGVGKTAFLYNFMMMNYHKHKITLLTNDMDEEEMSQRFGYFHRHIPDDAFEVYEKWDRFGDAIESEPSQIYLIDYLKVHDLFYMVAKEIDEVAAKIGKGMAIVALQKDKGKELGRGATFSLETPKLYLTMDFQKLNIVKARGRTKKEVDPRGLQIDFKLHNGTNFEVMGYGWPD